MTCWRRRIGSISWPAGAEAHGNSAKANRDEYDGAFISTQLTGGSEVNNKATVNAGLAGPEVDKSDSADLVPAQMDKFAGARQRTNINVNAPQIRSLA